MTRLLLGGVVFAMLVAIGVFGRWAQPDWSFTPIAAVALFAGCYFRNFAVAALAPLLAVALSNLALPRYDNVGVLFAVYIGFVLPVLLGRWLAAGRFASNSTRRCDASQADSGYSLSGLPLGRLAVCGVAPSATFFIITNFAVWLFRSDYERSLAGLAQCYAMAVPFYRGMLAGDLFYTTMLFGAAMLAGVTWKQAVRAKQVA